MRFLDIQIGAKRTKKWFAFLPVTLPIEIDGKERKEIRWLEFVTVEQEYGSLDDGVLSWGNIRFIDD